MTTFYDRVIFLYFRVDFHGFAVIQIFDNTHGPMNKYIRWMRTVFTNIPQTLSRAYCIVIIISANTT